MLSQFFKNAISLASLQLLNSGFGIIITPLLVNILDLSSYGEFSVQLAIVSILNIIIDFGFNLSAVRDITYNIKQNRKNVSYVRAVLKVRFLLFLVSAIIYSLYVVRSDNYEYLIFIFYLFGVSISCNYYFMAVQRMHIITVTTLVFRLLLMISLILFSYIKFKYLLMGVIVIYSASFVISGVVSLLLCYQSLKKESGVEKLVSGKNIFKSATPLFFSTAFSSAYRYLLIPIISMYCTSEIVGLFSAIDKIFKGFQTIINSAVQAVYPMLCRKSNLPKIFNVNNFSLIIIASYIFIYFSFSKIMWLFNIDKSVFPSGYDSTLLIFTLSYMIGSISYYISIRYFVSQGRNKHFLYSIITGFFVFVFSANIIGIVSHDYKIVISVLFSEVSIFIVIIVNRNRAINE